MPARRWDAAALARTTVAPVAIFQGDTDRQVPVDQAEALAHLFREAGNRDVTVHVFPGVNHLRVRDESGDFLRYNQLKSSKVDPDVLRVVAERVTVKLRAHTRG